MDLAGAGLAPDPCLAVPHRNVGECSAVDARLVAVVLEVAVGTAAARLEVMANVGARPVVRVLELARALPRTTQLLVGLFLGGLGGASALTSGRGRGGRRSTGRRGGLGGALEDKVAGGRALDGCLGGGRLVDTRALPALCLVGSGRGRRENSGGLAGIVAVQEALGRVLDIDKLGLLAQLVAARVVAVLGRKLGDSPRVGARALRVGRGYCRVVDRVAARARLLARVKVAVLEALGGAVGLRWSEHYLGLVVLTIQASSVLDSVEVAPEGASEVHATNVGGQWAATALAARRAERMLTSIFD